MIHSLFNIRDKPSEIDIQGDQDKQDLALDERILVGISKRLPLYRPLE